MRTKLLAVLAGSAIALTSASPAVAAPWDGNGFDFGLGKNWDLASNFIIQDVGLGATSVDFTQPASNVDRTNVWDYALQIGVRSVTAGITERTYYECIEPLANIDISMDADDLVISCEADWDAPDNSDIKIRGNMRIFGPDGDLIRYTLEIKNDSNSDITDFTGFPYGEWGSDAAIWAYQNFDSDVLAVPAMEDDANAALLNSVDSNWVVNYSTVHPPSSVAWGHNSASVDAFFWFLDGAEYYLETDTFTVGAGETVYLVAFASWDPANLNAISYQGEEYANKGDGDLAAAAVASTAVEFDSFDGRLTRGLPEGANVINWGIVQNQDDDQDEKLAPTGADNWSIWAGLALLVAGVAGRAIRRRVRA
jgi:hypothetical protein